MSENKALEKVEGDPVPENLHVDEAMVFVERALERGWNHEPSAQEVDEFDKSMQRKLKQIARRADREHADHENEAKE